MKQKDTLMKQKSTLLEQKTALLEQINTSLCKKRGKTASRTDNLPVVEHDDLVLGGKL